MRTPDEITSDIYVPEQEIEGLLEQIIWRTAMNIESQLLDGIRTLAPEKRLEVLDFIDFIQQRTATSEKKLRPIGLCKGEFTVPDDFDAPLPEEILRDFES